MKYLVFLFILFIFILSAIIGCSDEPNILGLGLIPPQDTLSIYATSIDATSDTAFIYRIGGISSTLIGFNTDELSNTSQEARSLIQFNGFTAISETTVVLSAVVKVPIDYKFKNSSGKLNFNIHEILQTWDAKTFTWNNCKIDSFYSHIPDTNFVKDIDATDSVLIVDVTPIVRRWVKNKNDAPNGIIFIPDTLRTNFIAGTRNNIDTMVITYRDTGTTSKTLSIIAAQYSFVANGAIPSIDTVRFIQAGIGYRNLIRFDVSSIPHRASITQAIFEVTSDENSSIRNSYSHDSLLVYLVRADTFPYASIALGTICPKSSDVTHTFYSADIKTIVQQWVVRDPNYGVILRSYSELTSFDRFAIFGAPSKESFRRPKLKIKYTVLP
jgi:hypothetical protein